jgi:integrase
MRALMGLIKDRHGTWCAQQKVPSRLQVAVARVLSNGKLKQVYLKRSLGTKSLKEANIRAKPVLAGFDRIIRDAAAIAQQPSATPQTRSSLNETEIKLMADYVYATMLAWDERWRVGGREELKRSEAELREIVREEGRELGTWAYPYNTLPPHGWSTAQLADSREQVEDDLRTMRDELALGNVLAVEDQVLEALHAFGINLAQESVSRPVLGIAILRAYVRALQAIGQRNDGDPVETPKVFIAARSTPETGGTLRNAAAGWERQRARPPRTVHEFRRSVEMFNGMHGDLLVAHIKRAHVLEFREALQDVPRLRKGPLLKASLPELRDWGRAHPEARKISEATINKQLSAVQAILVWANNNGLVPEDIGWSDPFSKMRLPEDQSDREPFELAELKKIFSSTLFGGDKKLRGSRGEAGTWLPLIALFTGARQAEIAGLTVADVQSDPGTGISYIVIAEQLKTGKRLKTKMSQRAIPVHDQLISLGLLDYVASRKDSGETAWLFPTVAPDKKGAVQAWSKWFGRYLRKTVGIVDATKVFHSFRHGFKDAARSGGVPLETHDALMGQSSASAVSQGYGAKQMLQRFTAKALKEAVDKVQYPGLDLARVRTGHERENDASTRVHNGKRSAP